MRETIALILFGLVALLMFLVPVIFMNHSPLFWIVVEAGIAAVMLPIVLLIYINKQAM